MESENKSLSSGIRTACEIMGVPLHGSDKFCRDSIEWLTQYGKVSISNEEDSWTVLYNMVVSSDDTLISALVGAVLASQSIEDEIEAWEAASDELEID